MNVISYVRNSNRKHWNEAGQKRLIVGLSSGYDVVSCSEVDPRSKTPKPGLVEAFGHLAACGVQALYVSSLDRLTRRADQLDSIQLWCSEQGLVIQKVPDIPESQ